MPSALLFPRRTKIFLELLPGSRAEPKEQMLSDNKANSNGVISFPFLCSSLFEALIVQNTKQNQGASNRKKPFFFLAQASGTFDQLTNNAVGLIVIFSAYS